MRAVISDSGGDTKIRGPGPRTGISYSGGPWLFCEFWAVLGDLPAGDQANVLRYCPKAGQLAWRKPYCWPGGSGGKGKVNRFILKEELVIDIFIVAFCVFY